MHGKALAGGWRTRGARDGGGFSCFSRHFPAPSSPGISPYDREGAPHSLASREFTVAEGTLLIEAPRKHFSQPNSLTLSPLLSSGWKSSEDRGTSLRPGDSGGGHRGDSAAGRVPAQGEPG